MKASSWAMAPARIVSLEMTRIFWRASTARAASFAIETVLPAPGGPTSMRAAAGRRSVERREGECRIERAG